MLLWYKAYLSYESEDLLYIKYYLKALSIMYSARSYVDSNPGNIFHN